MNLRERSKTDKKRRIKAAARDLFIAQGFDATTIRQIADKSGVGLATLFLYASDKRDLLFLTCNDELADLTERAFADVPSDVPFIEQLSVALRHFFIFYAQNRTLSRDLLRELTFFSGGQHGERFQRIRATTIGRLSDLAGRAKRAGSLAATQPDDLIGEVLFFLFAAEVRQWLAKETAPPEEGVRRLTKMLDVVVQGLAPSKTSLTRP